MKWRKWKCGGEEFRISGIRTVLAVSFFFFLQNPYFLFDNSRRSMFQLGRAWDLPNGLIEPAISGSENNAKNPWFDVHLYRFLSDPYVYLASLNASRCFQSRIGIYLAHNPAGTSTRNMLHFAQMVNSKRMASFDRGPEANVRWYGDVRSFAHFSNYKRHIYGDLQKAKSKYCF